LKDLFSREMESGEQTLGRKILRLFLGKRGEVVSGEEMSGALQVSRTAVWKHIRFLRELGCRIEAVPSRGYRLVAAPDLLLPELIGAGLKSARIGRNLVCLRETGSTNEEAFKLAEEGAEEGTVVVAEAQRRGKGRLGRQWESPAGVNLYCSVILRPPILPARAAQMTFLSSVAVARAIADETSLRPFIKWPNDLLINGRKVAGLLNEMSAETEKVNFIVLGIGVNINMQREQFPGTMRHPATSLFLETGKPVNRVDFTRALLEALDLLYGAYLDHGYGPVREEWLARCNFLGSRVRISFLDNELTGTAKGIDEEGALLVERPDGRVERVLAGDVTILR
jgi:BirA family transcriptional regulator, biotin operon repressor / biotin---[acetyl-CoA-carboxylase] ligase